MASKKGIELDARVQKVVMEEYADFERYIPSPQDVAVYRRKQKEYWDKIYARLKEETFDGRTADSTDSTAGK